MLQFVIRAFLIGEGNFFTDALEEAWMAIKVGFWWILLSLDGIIYSFIGYLYQIFLILSRANIFQSEMFIPFVRRIYMVIGVVMLFLLSYNLLTNIVNPDKGNKSTTGKTIFNSLKAIILLALIPTIFDFVYGLQSAILDQNTIGKLILGTTTSSVIHDESYTIPAATAKEVVEKGGTTMAASVLRAFIIGTDGTANPDILGTGRTLDQIFDEMELKSNFLSLGDFAKEIAADDKEVNYYAIFSTAAGIFVVYLLLTYCLALGVRVVKLAFYEIIAPIPIIASILPKYNDMLKKWVSTTLSTFIEVFMRVAVLYFAVYIIALITEVLDNDTLKASAFGNIAISGFSEALIRACLVMGVIAFIRKAPEYISEITGLKSSSMGMNLKEQLKNGMFFTGAAMLGGAATGMIRNMVAAGGNARNKYKERTKDLGDSTKDKFKKFGWGALSTLGGITRGINRGALGGLSGGLRSASTKTGSFSEARDAASKGAAKAGEKALHRAKYKEEHGGKLRGAMLGHIKDAGMGVRDWATYSAYDKYSNEIKAYDTLEKYDKQIDSDAEKILTKFKGNRALLSILSDGLTVEAKDNLLKNLYKNNNSKFALHDELVINGKYSLGTIENELEAQKNRTSFNLGETVKYFDEATKKWIDGYIDHTGAVFKKMAKDSTGKYYFDERVSDNASLLHSNYVQEFKDFVSILTKETKLNIKDAAYAKEEGSLLYTTIAGDAANLSSNLNQVVEFYAEEQSREAFKAAKTKIGEKNVTGAGHILKAYSDEVSERISEINLQRAAEERQREKRKKDK